MIVIDPLLTVVVTSLFLLAGAIVMWSVIREEPTWHPTPVRRIRRGAAVRVTHRLVTGTTTSVRPTLVIHGIVEDIRGDSIILRDQTQVTEDDLHGATVEVWRR